MKNLFLYKSAAVGIVLTLNIYALAKGYIGQDEAILVGGIMTALGLTGGYVTNKNYEKKVLPPKE